MIKKIYNKTLLKIFLAILLVICLIVSSNYIVLKNTVEEMQNQISVNNRLIVNNIISSFEQFFKVVDNLNYSINSLPYSVFETNREGDFDNYNINKIQTNYLSKFITPYEFVKDIGVNYKGSNTIITPVTFMSTKDFISQTYKSSKYNSRFWELTLSNSHPMIVIPSWENDFDAEEDEGIMTIIQDNNMSRFNIIIQVDELKLLKYVSWDNMFEGTSLMILDQDKNPLLKIGEEFSLDGFENLILNSANEFSFKYGKYDYLCVKSAYNNYFYINRIPSDFAEQFSTVKKNQMVIILSVLFGIIAAFAFSINLYSRIRKTLLLVGKGKDNDGANIFNEINKGIEDIKNENSYFKDEMRRVESEVQRSVFFKMIDDITYYRDIKNQIDTYFKVVFYSREYLMVALHFDTVNKIDYESSDMNRIKNIEDKADLINNSIKKRLNNTVLFQVESRQFIAIIGLDGDESKKTVLSCLEEILSEINNSFENNYRITALISKTYTEVKDCKLAYRDIRMCVACRNINSNNNIMDVEKIDFSHTTYFPGELIEKLSNCILVGNNEESIGIVNKIMDKNLENNTNYNKFITVIMSIFNSITGTLVLLGNGTDEIVEIENKYFDIIADNNINLDEIRRFFKTIIDQACIKARMQNQNKLNKEFIMQYINLHYVEDLYLEKMAEIVGTTPNYFSNYFKKNFGVNFVEYLNKIRISHARELLKNTKMPISEVAEISGFANTSTFTNTLKKYYGVSPTEYRKNFANEP